MKKIILIIFEVVLIKLVLLGQINSFNLELIPYSGGSKGYSIQMQNNYLYKSTHKLKSADNNFYLGDTINKKKIKLTKKETKKIQNLINNLENISKEDQICIDGWIYILEKNKKSYTLSTCNVNNYKNFYSLIKFISKKTKIFF